MKLRPAVLAAAAAVVLVLAQFGIPGNPGFHTWEYALVMALLTGVVLVEAWRGRRTWSALGFAGAAIVGIAGFASGLFGPDTQTIVRAPGTVAPIPDLGVAAFFAPADAATIESGSATVTLRRRGTGEVVLAAGGRRVVGDAIVMDEPRLAAFVEARSSTGDHLTVTQPTGGTFLSPILLFPSRQQIEGVNYPFDTFAVPAAHRIVRAVYFTAAQTTKMERLPTERRGKAAILFAVSGEDGRSLGITVAGSGDEVQIGGLRLRAVSGVYPALLVASAPYPVLLWLGGSLMTLGSFLASIRTLRGAHRQSAPLGGTL